MQFIENLRLAITSILANKMRSILTMLGIIIGISAVIMITTIGTSIQKTLVNTFNSMGSMNYFEVYTSWNYSEEDFGLTYTDNSEDRLSVEMLNQLVEQYPEYFYLNLSDDVGSFPLNNWKKQQISVNVSSITNFENLDDFPFVRGRGINQNDGNGLKQVMNVSTLFVEQYFPAGTNPIGQTVSTEIGDFVIVGVFELPDYYVKQMYNEGQQDIDKVTPVYIPYDTARHLLEKEQEPLYYADVYYYPEQDIDMLENLLNNYFQEIYKDKPYVQIEVFNMQSELGMINTVINVITIAISVIAAISLIVGGVGVMNIMLVSITERTKEIGVRKALGARNSAILAQFVVEAILLCLIGGIIGILLGVAGGVGIGFIAKFMVNQFYPEYAGMFKITIQPSIPAMLIAVIFSILTGVFFGYYPANKAAKLNPIDALRYD